MSTNGKTLNFRAAKIKGFTVYKASILPLLGKSGRNLYTK